MTQSVSTPVPPVAAPVATGGSPDRPYVDWPAILAGALLAAAIAFILSVFGAAIGLSVVSPFGNEGIGATGVSIAVGLWILWVAASSFMAGGYLAGRLRRRIPDASTHEADVRDGSHGLVVWAVGALIGAVLLASGAGTTARLGASAASVLADAVPEAAPQQAYEYAVDTLFRVPEGSAPTDASGDRARAEAVRIFAAGAADGEDGALAEGDRSYLAQLVARQTGLSPADAEARIDATADQLESAEQAALEAADAARKASVVAAFVLAASLLIGAAGACWAATVGGRHRDEGTVIAVLGNRS